MNNFYSGPQGIQGKQGNQGEQGFALQVITTKKTEQNFNEYIPSEDQQQIYKYEENKWLAVTFPEEGTYIYSYDNQNSKWVKQLMGYTSQIFYQNEEEHPIIINRINKNNLQNNELQFNFENFSILTDNKEIKIPTPVNEENFSKNNDINFITPSFLIFPQPNDYKFRYFSDTNEYLENKGYSKIASQPFSLVTIYEYNTTEGEG